METDTITDITKRKIGFNSPGPFDTMGIKNEMMDISPEGLLQ